MNTYYPPSELIINPDGSIYHLHLHPEQLADTIITVGDPERVAAVSRHFDTLETKVQHREFCTHTGILRGKRLSVISTGIGTDNIDIVFNELDALANIDFATRTPRSTLRQLTFVRIGTSGTLQPDLPVDSFLASAYAIGMDGLLPFYRYQRSQAEEQLFQALHPFLSDTPLPYYVAAADADLLSQFAPLMPTGITVTATGFYAPQGRHLRAVPTQTDFLERLQPFKRHDLRITNLEMETAGIYGLANLLGHKAISINALLANRATQTFSTQPQQTVEKLILRVLEQLAA